MSRERNERGRYVEKATIELVLEVLEQTDQPVLTAKEVANKLDVSSETARRKLNKLYEKEKVGRKKVGARAVVWWRIV